MRELFFVISLLVVTSSAFSQDRSDKSEYTEISLVEVNRLREECSRNDGLGKIDGRCFRSKCHLSLVNWNSYMGWMQLGFKSEGEFIGGHWKQGRDVFPFPEDEKPFTAFEVYYHYDIDYSLESFNLEFDYIDRLDDALFCGQKYIATDNLRIRSEPSLNARQTGLLKKKEKSTVIEVGEEVMIDGIDSVWVKVLTGDNRTGWCFAGYLTAGTVD